MSASVQVWLTSFCFGMQTTVHEALIYSAFLRLPGAVSRQVKEDFVEEIMSVVELTPLRHAIVGLPGTYQCSLYSDLLLKHSCSAGCHTCTVSADVHI